MANNKLTTASVLAFERKLANSDALMYAGNWEDKADSKKWVPIEITTKDVRGVISNRLKAAIANNEAKLDAEIQKANLQRVDVAALPQDADTLKLSFTLRVLGDLPTPSVCNKPDYQEALQEKISVYIETHQFSELSNRYAENIANGRFLWRNRVGAEAIQVHVKQVAQQNVKNQWSFDSHDFNLKKFQQPANGLAELAAVIKQGLNGDGYTFLEIEAFVLMGRGQEVFPSQELILGDSIEDNKSKVLYSVAEIAAMHSQKIGNALRTIDTWYSDDDQLGPIAVEPYGSVTSRGRAYRQPKEKKDFYNLLDRWVLKNELPSVAQQHFVIATLIRGGVFGDGS